MSPPGAARPSHPAWRQPGARAAGAVCKVYGDDGELIRRVDVVTARQLVDAGLADPVGRTQHVRLKLGIRWIPEMDVAAGRPDLEEMKRRNPGRYAALWRGTVDAKTGHGAIGRARPDRPIIFTRKN